MDEFTLENAPRSGSDSNNMKLDDWVLCRIHKKQPKSDDTDQNQQPSNINGLGLPPNSNERVATDVNTNLLGYDGSMDGFNLQNMATDLSTNLLGYDGSMEGFNQHNINPSHVNLTNGSAEVPQGCILPQVSFYYDISSQFFYDKDQNPQTRNTVQSGQWATQRVQFGDSTTVPGEWSVPVNERVATGPNTDFISNVGSMDFNQHNICSSHYNRSNGFAEVSQRRILQQDSHQTMTAGGLNNFNPSEFCCIFDRIPSEPDFFHEFI